MYAHARALQTGGLFGIVNESSLRSTIAGLYAAQFHIWDWIGRITTLSTMDGDWSALILFVISLILLVVFYVRSYQNTDHWIALSSVLILWSLATIVIVGLILLYMLQQKDKEKKQ